MRSLARGQPQGADRMSGAPFRPGPEDLRYLRRLGWTVLVMGVLLIIWRASDLLLLAFGSVLGAVVFRSAGRMLQKAGIRNWNLALGLGIALVLSVLGAMGYLLTVQFGSEIGGMLGSMPFEIKWSSMSLRTLSPTSLPMGLSSPLKRFRALTCISTSFLASLT